MLQLFLQISDRSTATRRGRFHFRETSLHDAETPLFSTVNFHDAETPLFNTVDLHATETPLVSPLDLLLRPNHHRPVLLTVLYCRNTIVSNPPLFSITVTPNSHLFPPPRTRQPFYHFLTILHRRNNFVQQLFRLSPSAAETPFTQHFRLSSDTETPFISSSSSTAIVSFFSVAETPVFHHRLSASFYALRLDFISKPSTQSKVSTMTGLPQTGMTSCW
jgi:hypothetical protein